MTGAPEPATEAAKIQTAKIQTAKIQTAQIQTAQIQAAKAAVWSALDGAVGAAAAGPASLLDEDVDFWGPAPIGRIQGRAAVIDQVYAPLARAFETAARRPALFLGGAFDDAIWVATTGVLAGPMAAPWLGVPPGRGARLLRFGEFYRFEGGRIVEIRCLFDVLGLAAQAGIALLPPFGGAAETPAGSREGETAGLMVGPQPEAETRATLGLVEDMLGGCNRLDARGLVSMGMQAYWRADMVWRGPWGVGSTDGFQAFQDFAQGPSVASFPDRRGGFHRARFADGRAAAFTGWPSLRGTFDGAPFRGIAPTGGPIGQNIMDFYLRVGDKLSENWVLIDLVDFACQCGVDLLAPLRQGGRID